MKMMKMPLVERVMKGNNLATRSAVGRVQQYDPGFLSSTQMRGRKNLSPFASFCPATPLLPSVFNAALH